MFKKIDENFSMSSQLSNLLEIMKLIYHVLLIAHIFSCIWIFIAIQEKQFGQNSWMQYKQISELDWQEQYLYAYYYTFVTMATVGYGDFSPITQKEMLLSIFTIMITCGMFAYVVNQIGKISAEIFQFQYDLKKNMKIINNYMAKKFITFNLQCQIREYLEYIWRESSEDKYEEQFIVEQLSDKLRDKLQIEANKIVLIDSPIFKNNFSQKLVQKTANIITEYKCTPEENIVLQDGMENLAIYFIQKGSIQLCMKQYKNEQIVYHKLVELNKGSSFGASSFFTGIPCQYDIRSSEFSTLLVIKRSDFMELLSNDIYDNDYETFCNISDNLKYYQRLEFIDEKCYSCQSFGHQITNCPLLHLDNNKTGVIKRNCLGSNQRTRDFNIRVLLKKQNSIQLNNKVVQQMLKFHDFREELLDQYELAYNITPFDDDDDDDHEEIPDEDDCLNNSKDIKNNQQSNISETDSESSSMSSQSDQEDKIIEIQNKITTQDQNPQNSPQSMKKKQRLMFPQPNDIIKIEEISNFIQELDGFDKDVNFLIEQSIDIENNIKPQEDENKMPIITIYNPEQTEELIKNQQMQYEKNSQKNKKQNRLSNSNFKSKSRFSQDLQSAQQLPYNPQQPYSRKSNDFQSRQNSQVLSKYQPSITSLDNKTSNLDSIPEQDIILPEYDQKFKKQDPKVITQKIVRRQSKQISQIQGLKGFQGFQQQLLQVNQDEDHNNIKIIRKLSNASNHKDKQTNIIEEMSQINKFNNQNILGASLILKNLQRRRSNIVQPLSFNQKKPDQQEKLTSQNELVLLKQKENLHQAEYIPDISLEFDKYKIYQIYFPHNNINKIILKYNSLFKKFKKNKQLTSMKFKKNSIISKQILRVHVKPNKEEQIRKSVITNMSNSTFLKQIVNNVDTFNQQDRSQNSIQDLNKQQNLVLNSDSCEQLIVKKSQQFFPKISVIEEVNDS